VIDVSNPDAVGAWVTELISKDQLHVFYTCQTWLTLREEVLVEYKHECQDCKARGRYSKATHVHHEKEVRRYPRLALSRYHIADGKKYRQLTPLCDGCHKKRHSKGEIKEPLTEERW